MENIEKLDLIGKLTQAISNHIQTSTRYLLALLLVSVITITSSIDKNQQSNSLQVYFFGSSTLANNKELSDFTGELNKIIEEKDISVPFVGNIKKDQFYPITSILISILLILYGISHTLAVRSKKLLGIITDGFCLDIYDAESRRINLKDICDSLSAPSLNKTAPLTQSMLGKKQFLHDKDHESTTLKIISKTCLDLYDRLLKLFSMLVIFGLPWLALFSAYQNGHLIDASKTIGALPIWTIWLSSIFALLISVQLIYFELRYSIFTSFRK